MSQSTRQTSKVVTGSLWLSQLLLAAVYLPAGLMKLMSPVAQVAQQIPWAADTPEWFVRSIGLVDLAAGVGILLPALLRLMPQLTVFAALGSMLLQVCAMAFHAYRGEWMVLPVNGVILLLSYWVWVGRRQHTAMNSQQ